MSKTTVVFDAREAPPGLPRTVRHRGITVCFAEPGLSADDVIERLILADSSPRRLTVVSSDHRLHRAARRRNAKPVDSDRWYAETLRQRIDRSRRKNPGTKPTGPPTDSEVRFWLRQFGLEEPAAEGAPASEPPTSSPFPPGYGDDVDDDDS